MKSATEVVDFALEQLAGDPVFMAGSLVAAQTYGVDDAFSDVDIFCPNEMQLAATVQRLLSQGFRFAPRMERAWARWRKHGVKRWHTNSMRLWVPEHIDNSDEPLEFNIVFKRNEGNDVTSLAQTIESFDFGLLATGWELADGGTFRDMRSYLFPELDPYGPLPLMPNKRVNWREGIISQYNGLREAGRYAKYFNYGYDMSAVKEDLALGYREAEVFHADRFGENAEYMAAIYGRLAEYIEDDDTTGLLEAYKKLDFNDALDLIMEALE